MPVRSFPVKVQQKDTATFKLPQHVIFMQVHGIVAGQEIRAVYQIGAADGAFPEAQVGDSQASGLFGIVFKIALGGQVCVVADDFDGVLGGADSAVPAQAPELTGDDVLRGCLADGGHGQGQMGDVIGDAYREKGPGLVVINGGNLIRGGVLGAQSLSAGENPYAFGGCLG